MLKILSEYYQETLLPETTTLEFHPEPDVIPGVRAGYFEVFFYDPRKAAEDAAHEAAG